MGYEHDIASCHRCPKRQRFADKVGPLLLCTCNGRPIQENAGGATCPEKRFRTRGLGDVLARAVAKTVAKVFPRIRKCGGCKKRRNALNKVFPAKSVELEDKR